MGYLNLNLNRIVSSPNTSKQTKKVRAESDVIKDVLLIIW